MFSFRLLLIYATLSAWYVVRVAAPTAVGVLLFKRAIDVLPSQTASMTAVNSVATNRTIFTATSHLCILVLGCIFGSRFRHFTRKSLARPSVIQVLILLLYFLSASFVLSAALLQTGLNLSSRTACDAAIYCCLTFYFTSKGVILLFLTERLHAIRLHRTPRRRDWVWLAFTTAIALPFGAILVLAYLRPIAEVSEVDGICRIGVPLYLSLPLMVYEIGINSALTAVFLWLLRPLIRRRRMPSNPTARGPSRIVVQTMVSHTSSAQSPERDRSAATVGGVDDVSAAKQGDSQVTNVIEREVPTDEGLEHGLPQDAVISRRWWVIERLAKKSMIGTVLIIVPTIINLVLLSSLQGREQGWVCFTFCTADVTWAVVILHWLTTGMAETPATGSADKPSESA